MHNCTSMWFPAPLWSGAVKPAGGYTKHSRQYATFPIQSGAKAPDFVRAVRAVDDKKLPLILLWSLNDLTDTVNNKRVAKPEIPAQFNAGFLELV